MADHSAAATGPTDAVGAVVRRQREVAVAHRLDDGRVEVGGVLVQRHRAHVRTVHGLGRRIVHLVLVQHDGGRWSARVRRRRSDRGNEGVVAASLSLVGERRRGRGEERSGPDDEVIDGEGRPFKNRLGQLLESALEGSEENPSVVDDDAPVARALSYREFSAVLSSELDRLFEEEEEEKEEAGRRGCGARRRRGRGAAEAAAAVSVRSK